MAARTFTGIGFGAIQAGLFLYEAHESGNFSRYVVAEVMQDVVDAVRKNHGTCNVSIATQNGIETRDIRGLEIYNPRVPSDREALVQAVAESAEICTALPSVKFFGKGDTGDVVDILSAGFRLKAELKSLPNAVIYTAENHNHAAEILEDLLKKHAGPDLSCERFQCLNTVIGKMSGVVTDPEQIKEQKLAPIVPGARRAFLVEAFNRILITRIKWNDFKRGISVFEEKPDLLPFEEAKLYGHNATHALIGYLLGGKGGVFMAEAVKDPGLLEFAREAFLEESGRALCRKHAGLDPLFTERGYAQYAEDLLSRMMNPHLRDTAERITRDPKRKLGWDDRLVGTMRVALSQGVTPVRYAAGAAAALRMLQKTEVGTAVEILDAVWREAEATPDARKSISDLILGVGKQRQKERGPSLM